MQELRANTAVDVLLGQHVDLTDGTTAETGLTMVVDISKNGQAMAAKNDATAASHDAAGTIDGYYNCEFDATDTNTVGTLKVASGEVAASRIVTTEFMVLTEEAWDMKYDSTTTGRMKTATDWVPTIAATYNHVVT